jgi:cytoskeleton protein RodZ
MKEPLRVPFESGEPDLAGPRLVHETDGDDRHAVPAFCDELREARLRGGYSVGDAAQVLRIQEHYLQALEEGRFDQIPGTTYAIGFLRSYAGFLGLDPDEMVDAFKREQGLQPNEHRLAFPAPSDTSPKPKFWLILLVLVLAGLGYGGWQYQSTEGRIATDLVADVSTRLSEAVGLDTADAPQQAAAVAPDAAPDSAPVAAGSADPAAPVSEETAPAASPPPETASAEPATTEVAALETTEVAGTSDRPGPERATEAGAAEGAPPDAEPAPTPPSKVEAAAADALAPAEPSAAAEPGRPAGAGEETAGRRPAIAAPLDFATTAVGGPGTATATGAAAGAATDGADVAAQAGGTRPGAPDERVVAGGDTVAAQEALPQPTIDATPPQTTDPTPPAENVTLAAVGEAGSWPSADTGYVPKVYGRSNADARVVVTAIDDSWVQVQGPDNELLLTRILHAGDSYRVPDRPGLVMVTGNAGGLRMRVDDATAPVLGPLGVVMRNIALDPDRLLAGTAARR